MAPVTIIEEAVGEPRPNAIRVLVTGFGPFWRYTENPSWSAVKPLANTILHVEPSSDPVFVQNSQSLSAQNPQHPIIVRADQIAAVHLDDQLDLMPVDDLDATPLEPVEIHITALQIPVAYQAVLSTVPGLHARPPVLPEPPNGDPSIPDPPENGYDFIFHVGVAGRGHLRLEQLAHKHGYRMKDADGQYAPVVHVVKEIPKDIDAEMMEIQRNIARVTDTRSPSAPDGGPSPIPVTEIGPPAPVTDIPPPLPAADIPPSLLSNRPVPYQVPLRANLPDPALSDLDDALDTAPDTPDDMNETPDMNEDVGNVVVRPIIETHEQAVVRGYGTGYEMFSDEVATEIDVASLIHNMKEAGHTQVYSSMDAGHYLCDFLYFGSLAEAKRAAANKEKDKIRNTPPRATPTLFMHCPPDGQPLKTEAVTEAIKFIVAWVCRRTRP